MSLLCIRNLSVVVKQRRQVTPLLTDISLDVDAGEVCGLVGQSGAGKSMIARTVLGLLPEAARIEQGSIEFDGRALLQDKRIRGQGIIGKEISLIPQDPMVSLNPVRRIGRQMCDVIQLHMGENQTAAKRRSLELFEEVLIREPERVFESYAHELSGGMRQRVLIATAFAVDPKLIIADEPTTALDVTVQKRVLQLLRNLQRKRNTAVLFVTHDLGVVAKICDRVAVLRDGKLLEHADTTQIFNQPSHAYTRALLDATPRYDQPDKPLAPVNDSELEVAAGPGDD